MVRDLLRKRRGQPGQPEDLSTVLSERQHELVTREIEVIDRLLVVLRGYPASAPDLLQLEEAKNQLGDLFLLVIAGEFNAGKSAFINALIGANIMPEGVTPTTSVINLLRHGDAVTERMLPSGMIERTWPAPFLEDITVVDTPGTNAIVREHEALTERFVPRSDIVFFVTSADRPFTESERAFMEEIRDWGKKIVLVINKIDLLRDLESLNEIVGFVQGNVERLLGFRPEVYPVSALLAQQSKDLAARNPAEAQRLWEQSQFGPLETYIFQTLDESERIRLKLLNPLGTAEFLDDRYSDDVAERLAILEEDVRTIDTIDRQLVLYQEDMRRQFAYHKTKIENIIARMNARGDDFFEETIRLGRIFDLLKSEKVEADFQKQVIADTEKEIDATVDELIDWMVEEDLRTWEAITGYLDRRRLTQYEGEMVGEVTSQFKYDRRALIDAVSRRAQEEVERYDADRAAIELSQSIRTAVAQVAVTEAGALGLGALVVAAATTVAFDITGILAASLIAGLGLFILPRKRKQAREDFRSRSEDLENRLIEVMNDQFETELGRSVQRMESAVAPYSRFVRDQQARLTGIQAELAEIRSDLRGLRYQIGAPEIEPAPTTITERPPESLPGGTAPALPAESEE